MLLHEFLRAYRNELIDAVGTKLANKYPGRNRAELVDGLHDLVGDIIKALEVHTRALPNTDIELEYEKLASAALTGARLGEERERAGYQINTVPETVGLISSTFGEIGEREGMAFSASEYKVFNESIDMAVSRGIERFWQEALSRDQQSQAKRIGAFAHELRNALSAARMAFATLRGGSVSISGRTGDLMARSLGRMEALVSQTLGAVALNASLSPTLEALNLEAFVRELVEATVPERGIRISQVGLSGETELLGDQRLASTALSNVLQNAVKFTRDNGQIVVRTRSEDQRVCIEIEDECGGLPAGNAEELFAPFVQHGRDRRGVGLGLSITLEAMQAQGGDVVVRDVPGKGCVFTLRFPVSRSAGSPSK